METKLRTGRSQSPGLSTEVGSTDTPHSRSQSPVERHAIAVGDGVLVDSRGRWLHAKVLSMNAETFTVAHDMDGGIEEVPRNRVISAAALQAIKPGEKVKVEWHGRWYDAKVERENPDGTTYRVIYDSNRSPEDVPRYRIHQQEVRYTPDGQPLPKVVQVPMEEQALEQGWYHAESNLVDQEMIAQRNFAELCKNVDNLHMSGLCPSKRWTNDPEVFPDMGLGIRPFPPNDNQMYVPWPPMPPPEPDFPWADKEVDDDVCVGRGAKKPEKKKTEVILGADPFLTAPLKLDPLTGLPLALIEEEKEEEHRQAMEALKVGGYASVERGGKRYDATILKINLDDTFDVQYDEDDTTEQRVPLSRVQDDYDGRKYKEEEAAAAVAGAANAFDGWSYGPPQETGLRRPGGAWVRLVDYCVGGGIPGVASVFGDERSNSRQATHLGRVYQGELQNAYFVEALNAITLRPKLVRQLFYAWDIQRSIYILRLHTNGTWARIEIDDYVPNPPNTELNEEAPFCCRSEFFPYVLWPSLVEKAYAKMSTIRANSPARGSGGWEALGGGGDVCDALADLTGGVAGSFSTKDVSPDRLFVYLHELQRDCLFVCRVNPVAVAKIGVPMDPTKPHAINRATHHQGQGYIQVFSPLSGGDGGLSQVVPDEVVEKYPGSQTKDGFFWLRIEDFHQCFGTIFECRLTNSADVGLPDMPPSRLPNANILPQAGPVLPGAPPMTPGGGMSWLAPGCQPLYFETVCANAGYISEHNPPEFTVTLPNRPCEVVAVLQQTDSRIVQVGPVRKPYTAVLLKVYEQIRGNYYSSDMVCKSNWMPSRDSMVAFKSDHGGVFKISAELPHGGEPCDRLIFRCYVSTMGAQISAATASMNHYLVEPTRPSQALKWTLVGCVPPQRVAVLNMPMPLHAGLMEDDLDTMKKRKAAGEECVIT